MEGPGYVFELSRFQSDKIGEEESSLSPNHRGRRKMKLKSEKSGIIGAALLAAVSLFSCGGSEDGGGHPSKPESPNRYRVTAKRMQTANLTVSFSVGYISSIPTPEEALNESIEEDPHYAVAIFACSYDPQTGMENERIHLTHHDIRDFGDREKFGFKVDPNYPVPKGVVCWSPPDEAYSYDFSVDLSYPIADLPFDKGALDYRMTVEDDKGNYKEFFMGSGRSHIAYQRIGNKVIVS